MRLPAAPAVDRARRRPPPAAPALLVVAALVASLAAFAGEPTGDGGALERIDALAASGAWQLALGRLETMQEQASGEHWEALERRRYDLYRALEDCPQYSARVARLPDDASPELRRTGLAGVLETCLAAGDASRAERALERLAALPESDAVPEWRERLARLHLRQGHAERAAAVLAPLPDDAAPELRAEALLYQGREREAFERLAGLTSREARLWRLLALWRLDLYAPEDAVTELSRLVRELADRPRLLRIAWLARAHAAGRAGQLTRRVHSLEQAFELEPHRVETPIAAGPEDLWSAYLALARHQAANEDLTLGRGTLEHADGLAGARGYEARALYAWLALEADDAGLREEAHARLARALVARDLRTVVRALYTESRRFAPAAAPVAVRHVLLAEALERGDLRAAAAHARDLEAPPEDQSEGDWQLRRARVLLYGGEADASHALLARLVERDEFDAEYAARWVQVVFDLQALGRHEQALDLLESAQARVDNARMRRELLYWRAESASALGRHREAAELYLRSAQLDADGRDPWGHSARYRAAEALGAAGLREDAEAVYRALLAETSAPRRRLLIEQHIERLWRDAHPATTP